MRVRSRSFPREGLLDLDRRSLLLELLLHVLGLGLGHLLLDRFRRAVDEVLGLLQAEPRELAHDLDDLDLLVAGRSEDDVELRLLLHGGGAAGRRPGRPRHGGHRHRRGGGHAPLLLQQLAELRCLEHRQLASSSAICSMLAIARSSPCYAVVCSASLPRCDRTYTSSRCGACSRPTSWASGPWMAPTICARSASFDGRSASAFSPAGCSIWPST